MKKLTALLMVIALMATMMTTAMAYDAVSFPKHEITHKLLLDDDEATQLYYNITYDFTVHDAKIIGENDFNGTSPVSGKPIIKVKDATIDNQVVYTPDDTFDSSNRTTTKTLTIDWSGVSITEPGVYRWEVEQKVTTDAPENASNNNSTFYLWAYVTVNADNQLEANCKVTTEEDFGTDDEPNKYKVTELSEQYPAKAIDLTISKTVDGSQGSKDQYFPFTIVLNTPKETDGSTLLGEFTYSLSGNFTSGAIPADAYDSGNRSNPTNTITITNGTSGSVTVWLKHGENITIEDMIYGTSFTITEGGNAGYEVKAEATSIDTDTFSFTKETAKAEDTHLKDDMTVAFTNTKNVATPTGITLETSAAIAGMLLAMGLMVLMFLGKRKETV